MPNGTMIREGGKRSAANRSVSVQGSFIYFKTAGAASLTDAEEDLVDVHGGEVQEEEEEVDDEQEEAQNHTHPLLEALT